MSPKSKLKALDTLLASRGWNIVREVMEQRFFVFNDQDLCHDLSYIKYSVFGGV